MCGGVCLSCQCGQAAAAGAGAELPARRLAQPPPQAALVCRQALQVSQPPCPLPPFPCRTLTGPLPSLCGPQQQQARATAGPPPVLRYGDGGVQASSHRLRPFLRAPALPPAPAPAPAALLGATQPLLAIGLRWAPAARARGARRPGRRRRRRVDHGKTQHRLEPRPSAPAHLPPRPALTTHLCLPCAHGGDQQQPSNFAAHQSRYQPPAGPSVLHTQRAPYPMTQEASAGPSSRGSVSSAPTHKHANGGLFLVRERD